jgi:AraC-like DNA-binding protein
MKFFLFPKLSELFANNCGISILNPGWIHPKRNLNTSVLILGKKSKVEMEEESEPFSIEPDKFSILAAEQTHWGSQKIIESASYYWMHFTSAETPKLVPEQEAVKILENQTLVQTRMENALLLPQEIRLKESKEFLDLFHDLLFEQENPSFTPLKIQMLFRLMMIKINETVLSEYISKKYDSTKFSLIYAIIQTVFENFTDCNFSVKSLADKMNYNPDYLCRAFKIHMSKSLSDYIIDQRIKYAVCLLVESNNSVDSIAYDCGFNSSRNFVRQFKARKNETPSELRLRHRTMHINNR